jgi:predicted nucleic acid-binding protein
MIVVSDTAAVTTLLKAGMESLLSDLFGTVTIPQAVWEELLAFHSHLPDFVLLRPVALTDPRFPQTEGLGRGEAEAITLAKSIDSDLLLADDLKARSVAAELNIKYTGLLGVLIRGKQRGYIATVKEGIAALEARGGLYLADAVKAEALKLADEID